MQASRNFQVATAHVEEETGKVHPLSDTVCQGMQNEVSNVDRKNFVKHSLDNS